MELTWPPKYTFRRSKRARYLRLLIRPDVSVEIVLPWFVSKAQGLQFLEEKRHWVMQSLQRASLEAKPKITEWVLPDHITLPSIDQVWQVNYEPLSSRKRVTLYQSDNQLLLVGATAEKNKVALRLRGWLLAQAEQCLSPRFHQMAQQHQFDYRQLQFRFQKSRWGSCSSEGNISLNTKLLFLPVEMVDYVMVHELCHLKHMNHSRAFWRTVERMMPDYKTHDRALRLADQHIPDWATKK